MLYRKEVDIEIDMGKREANFLTKSPTWKKVSNGGPSIFSDGSMFEKERKKKKNLNFSKKDILF